MSEHYNRMLCSTLVLLLMVNFIPSSVQGMKSQVLSNEDVKIQAHFYLGEMYALGEGCEKDVKQAQVYFEQVVDQEVDKEARAWSCLWLSKFCLDKGNEAEEYLGKASSYGEGLSFISQLANLLKEFNGMMLDQEK